MHMKTPSGKVIISGKQARKGEVDRDAGSKLLAMGNGLFKENEPNLSMILLTSLCETQGNYTESSLFSSVEG